MELLDNNNNNSHVEQKPVSVLKDDRFCAGRILAREVSVGQSSRIFYRAAEGVPFTWEMLPGTPKNPQHEGDMPPLSPPPQVQGLGLPLPNLDDGGDESKQTFVKSLRIGSLKKMVKKGIRVEVLSRRKGSKRSSRFEDSDGEFVGSVKGSSFSSYSSSLSSNRQIMDSSRLPGDTVDGPFCCSPWNISAILDEGNTKIYYCREHKTAFAVEEDGSYLSRILTKASVSDQFSGPLNSGVTSAGVPFDWEMQPGTPKQPQGDELIPPPSPPPAVQSSTLPLPNVQMDEEKVSKASWKRPLVWIQEKYNNTKRSGKQDKDASIKRCEEGFDASFRESTSRSSASFVPSLSKDGWRVSKIKRSLKIGPSSCGPWSRKEILVFARTKLKSLKSSH